MPGPSNRAFVDCTVDHHHMYRHTKPNRLYLWYTECMDAIERVVLLVCRWVVVVLVHDANNYGSGNVPVFLVDIQTM